MKARNLTISFIALTMCSLSTLSLAGDKNQYLSFGRAMVDGGSGSNITYSHLAQTLGWTASARFLSGHNTSRHYATGVLSYAHPLGSQLVLTAGSGLSILRTRTTDLLPTDPAFGNFLGREIKGANYYFNAVAELGMAVRYQDVMYSFTFDAVPQIGTFNLGFAF